MVKALPLEFTLEKFNLNLTGRILSIDYGTKRTGLAWTDPMRIIATGLETIPTHLLLAKISELLVSGPVTEIVVGMPLNLDGGPTDSTSQVIGLVRKLKKTYPELIVNIADERFTSIEAENAIRSAGLKKSKRADKNLVNSVAAVLILQTYLGLPK